MLQPRALCRNILQASIGCSLVLSAGISFRFVQFAAWALCRNILQSCGGSSLGVHAGISFRLVYFAAFVPVPEYSLYLYSLHTRALYRNILVNSAAQGSVTEYPLDVYRLQTSFLCMNIFLANIVCSLELSDRIQFCFVQVAAQCSLPLYPFGLYGLQPNSKCRNIVLVCIGCILGNFVGISLNFYELRTRALCRNISQFLWVAAQGSLLEYTLGLYRLLP